MKKNGFTLIEMLIVLIIMGILAGLITTTAIKTLQDAKKNEAEAVISAVASALSRYESDVGDYPPHFSVSDFSSCNFVDYLQEGKTNPGFVDITGWNGPYMQFKDVSGSFYLDPWEQPYQYRRGSPPFTQNERFDLWSWGPDGYGGSTDDDITNW